MIVFGTTPRIEFGTTSKVEHAPAHVRIESNRAVVEFPSTNRIQCGLGGNCNRCKLRKHCINHR